MVEAPRDFVELFRSLNAKRVEYLIVGGYAVAFYGYPRFTGDIDFFINPSRENASRMLAALEDFGFVGLDLTEADFLSPDLLVSLGYAPERVDIVSSISGVTWKEAWENRFTGSFGGENVFFIGRSDLIRNKRSTGRPQDKVDADVLDLPPPSVQDDSPCPA
ncbi:MAG: hypothetical protein WCT14_05420 [Treponemataceae bacterium]